VTAGDVLGWIASALVFSTFLAHEMRLLRTLAIFSNIAFIAYGGLYHLWPIVALHLAMVPVNVVRLRQTFLGAPKGRLAVLPSTLAPNEAAL
jgi:CRP/FNR family transcriptional regulator, cyclic AMP receptor protein